MMKKPYQPFIPDGKINKAFIGKADREIREFVESFGIETVISRENPKLDKPIANHADVNIFIFSESLVFADSTQSKLLHGSFAEKEICISEVSSPYPNDCKLNVAVIGQTVFAKLDSVDEGLLTLFRENNFKLVNIRQGYAKCSTCIIDEKNIITDDVSIHKAAGENGVNSLLVEKGDIRLDGYDCGFIGGASALIDKKHLLFFGDITRHRSFNEIKNFLSYCDCKFDFIKDHPLTDIGGLIGFSE